MRPGKMKMNTAANEKQVNRQSNPVDEPISTFRTGIMLSKLRKDSFMKEIDSRQRALVGG